MIPILITEGDPCGIGPEILQMSRERLNILSQQRQILLISSNSSLSYPGWQEIKDPFSIHSPGLYLWRTSAITSSEQKSLLVGKPSAASGKAAFASLEEAVRIQKKIGGNLITLPLSKEWVIKSGVKKFIGHTEYLAEVYKKRTYMLMAGRELNVLPLTTHVPLKKVPSYLKKIHLSSFISAVRSAPISKGKIAFLGLNPHAGEGGKVGDEEKKILMPIILKMRKAGLDVTDPLSADGAFSETSRAKYSLFLACYHDQGLIPFKMWEGKFGVNVTLGLDFIRVSPDHGTAFDIAGLGKADPESFLQCLEWVSGRVSAENDLRRSH
ncbi:4-hydroxythreonine-4-phosphate dehydrogenase [Leptospira hartskeerlii]|uniref:4-hydroxythreonine-4-phosphate dehydrogenase n=2 Tax=Leptospira hartskeerlii TaxID=2023177 RepID=A0A2M9X9B4_9LEPT|nr:4-hydroxythreonine-4-phosphate dehydrogenase PdxA [Leptospira hartskeerlii]PJZ24280.1 4-hydroxythreonine-4-phosphate dehydrogenase [Leptospira hartskeerlii]PJZ32465.1 4-hydroxythreonine-4-phosphate dehydrogenase [Leptospira hartskeerlii]